MTTIESLMRRMEEDRRQRRIAALSDDIQADGGMWKVEPSPAACPTCLELSRKIYAEKPNPPHPHCKCRISKQEKKKRYYVIGRRPLDGLEPISTTQLDWIKKWDKNAYKSGKGGLPDLLPEHRHFFDSEGKDFGFFGDDNVRPDRKRNLPLYTYGDVKYDADIVDRAAKEYETYINQTQEKISKFTKSTKDMITNQVHGHVNTGKYGLILNNCQDYVSNIYTLPVVFQKKNVSLLLYDKKKTVKFNNIIPK